LSPQALLLGFLLLVSPVAIWASPVAEGGDMNMNPPAELSIEDFEAELSLEEWMTQPFDHGFSDFEEELVVEDWMIQPF